MADTVREQIITAFATRAQSLSTKPVQRVLRSSDEIPANTRFITIWDGDDEALEAGYGIQKMQFPIALECVFPHGNVNPSIAANAVIGEIIKTIYTGSQTFSNLATAMNLASCQPIYPQDGGKNTAVLVTFNIIYTTKKGDPYVILP